MKIRGGVDFMFWTTLSLGIILGGCIAFAVFSLLVLSHLEVTPTHQN